MFSMAPGNITKIQHVYKMRYCSQHKNEAFEKKKKKKRSEVKILLSTPAFRRFFFILRFFSFPFPFVSFYSQLSLCLLAPLPFISPFTYFFLLTFPSVFCLAAFNRFPKSSLKRSDIIAHSWIYAMAYDEAAGGKHPSPPLHAKKCGQKSRYKGHKKGKKKLEIPSW